MSISENPLLGPMRKSMGNFTMYSYHGMNIVRSKAFKVKDAKSEKQLIMRARMAGIAELYRTFRSVIGLGFPDNKDGKSPQNLFVAANISTAFEMTDNMTVISYPKLLVAKGSLPAVKVTEAFMDVTGITVRYDAEALFSYVTPTDEIITCALLKSGELLIIRQIIGYQAVGIVRLNYQSLQEEYVTACYVFARTEKTSSNSIYVEVRG